MPKYDSETLAPMFRLAAELCVQMRKANFTDNGGAIHSAERILNLWGLNLNFPGLSHINNLKKYERAVFSTKAYAAHRRGEPVFIEHVAPLRALTREAVALVERGAPNEIIEKLVRAKFQLVLLTEAESTHLNSRNRSKIEKNRLGKSGIRLKARKKLRHT